MTVRLAASPAPALALGALWVPTQYLDEAPPAEGSRFGSSLRMIDDLLVVGVPYADNGPAPASGRAYIYRRVGGVWQFEKLLTPTPQTDAHFGWAVAVSMQTVPVVIVGEPDRDGPNGVDAGFVYIYQYVNGTWGFVEVATGQAGDRLGAALDAVGDNFVVGSPGWDASAALDDQNVGLVTTFNRCGPNVWCGTYSYSEAPLHANAHFGAAVAIAGERVIIGAPGDGNNSDQSGSAWIDNLSAGGPVATPIMLTDPTPGGVEQFGSSVAAAGIVFAVGSRFDDEPMGVVSSGAVHIFALSGATALLEKTLRSPAPQDFAQFGAAIELTSTRIIIGEPYRDVFSFGGTSLDAGAAHVYRRFFVASGYTWANVTTIYNFFGEGELFGAAVASANGVQFAAGAPSRSVDALSLAGEVTVYQPDLVFADGFD